MFGRQNLPIEKCLTENIHIPPVELELGSPTAHYLAMPFYGNVWIRHGVAFSADFLTHRNTEA